MISGQFGAVPERLDRPNAGQLLRETAVRLFSDDKGLLAMDESTSTCNARFAELGIPQTEEMRRAYREMIITTPGLGDCINGAILADETFFQSKTDGTPFLEVMAKAGITPGIKVDGGLTDLALHPGEKVTQGLDGLRERLNKYAAGGARFAKWRAVFSVGPVGPSRTCIEVNTHALARYAALCQEAGLVPIVEPEVLMTGKHTLNHCGAVLEAALHALFVEIDKQNVLLEGLIVKPNMVVPGVDSADQGTLDEVVDATVQCLLRGVPAAVPAVAFLSGGQSGELACERLNAMNIKYKGRLPWALSYSFARAIQHPAIQIWHGDPANVEAAQKALYHRAACAKAARAGLYNASMEQA